MRSVTISNKNSKREIRLLKATVCHEEITGRPRTRGDCIDVPRPCPFVGCEYNNYLDINGDNGSLKINFPDKEPWEIEPRGSCALDVADEAGCTLEEVGTILNVSRERIRQIESHVLKRFAQDIELQNCFYGGDV